ncbi:Head-to-tail connector protein, podovirus-type [uncultured Caudovirales phage]|uniref:Head-to-tail connector protein, podovirus-type n=1 Tax=uncultured Caudovirales phage TaxID=2100421 RepID=A0A6J7X6Y4_9CAUD|nr:Head-to-tail connector protein, podovirus-type [uncultured Caudovirales phage]CAB5225310.1 Head-to-tail connector protein, podovirus-type [uncultured Caudovirales phage]
MMDGRAIIGRADQLKSARSNFANFWQEVADYILPAREFNRKSSPGQQRVTKIFHTGPITAHDNLAAGLHGMLTSPSLRWFRLRADRAGQNPAMGHNGGPAMDDGGWFEAATEALYAVFNSPRSGFDVAAQELYLDVTAFGNGPMFMEDRGAQGIAFHSIALAECFIALDPTGKVDTLFRQYQMTARQVVTQWPDAVPVKVRQQAEKEPDALLDVVHAVYPKPESDKGQPFKSCYVLRAHPDRMLEEKGYRRFPYIWARWQRRSGEDYGTGPAMKLLPDVRVINKLEEINLRGLAKVVDPAMFVPDDGFLAPLRTSPGALNYFRGGTLAEGDRPFTLPNAARPDIGMDAMQMLEARIRSGFYVDWLALPTRPTMTATEVLQRRDEQLRLLGPMVARLQREFLGPLIEWTLDTLLYNGWIPPAPQGVEAFEIEYQSPLALSQKRSDADATLMWVQAVGQMAQGGAADALDVVDGAAAARKLAEQFGVPHEIIRSVEEAAQVAQQRAQQQQMAVEMEAAQGAASAARDGAQAMQAMMPQQQGAM